MHTQTRARAHTQTHTDTRTGMYTHTHTHTHTHTQVLNDSDSVAYFVDDAPVSQSTYIHSFDSGSHAYSRSRYLVLATPPSASKVQQLQRQLKFLTGRSPGRGRRYAT